MYSAESPALQDVPCLLKLRHAALLSPHLNDPLVFVLSPNYGVALAEFMRQGLLHVHILAAVASVHRHGHVPVIRRADQNRIDVAACQEFVVVPRHEGTATGDLLCLLDRFVPNVANRCDPRAGHFCQIGHQSPTPTTGADAPDVQGFIGRIREGGGRASSGGADQEVAAVGLSWRHGRHPRDPYGPRTASILHRTDWNRVVGQCLGIRCIQKRNADFTGPSGVSLSPELPDEKDQQSVSNGESG